MAQELRGKSRSAPSSPPSAGGQSGTREAERAREAQGELSPECHEQVRRAVEQRALHHGRMAKKAGHTLAEDMWSNIMLSLHTRLVNRGPVEHLDSYLNACVTNQVSSLRATIEILVGDENPELHVGDPNIGEVLELNHELFELVKGIRALGFLTQEEADVFVLFQVLGEDSKTVAEWLAPGTDPKRATRIRRRAVKKVNRAYKDGILADLGYDGT
ncbi:hypothetical protein [Streptomyces sp. NPDC059398]|uniref:hypothetical protein n=1 Tax=Streptomyces sp. NPDC059398 TaxID=3346820 RepID=UPI0036C34FA8